MEVATLFWITPATLKLAITALRATQATHMITSLKAAHKTSFATQLQNVRAAPSTLTLKVASVLLAKLVLSLAISATPAMLPNVSLALLDSTLAAQMQLAIHAIQQIQDA
jgi:hypothetical protein